MADSNQNNNSESSEKRKALIKKSDKSALRMDRLAVLIVIGFLIIAAFVPFDTFDKVAALFPSLDMKLFTVSVIVSIGAGIICYIELDKKMNNVKHASKATGYLDTESVNVPIMSDKFVVYKSYKRGRINETSEDPNKGDF